MNPEHLIAKVLRYPDLQPNSEVRGPVCLGRKASWHTFLGCKLRRSMTQGDRKANGTPNQSGGGQHLMVGSSRARL